MVGLYLINLLPNYIFYITDYFFINIYFFSKFIISFSYILKKHINTLYKVLVDLVTADYYQYKLRFLNIYNLLSINNNNRIFIKTYINKFFKINSLIKVYTNINWFERESWDLYGIYYCFHNDLRRLLNDYIFKGFPFRKDFPITGFLELKYDFIKKKLIYDNLKLTQEFRNFNAILSWDYVVY